MYVDLWQYPPHPANSHRILTYFPAGGDYSQLEVQLRDHPLQWRCDAYSMLDYCAAFADSPLFTRALARVGRLRKKTRHSR